jgi:hypothetical protein
MLLLNTADLPDEDRVQTVGAASGQSSVFCRIDHLGPGDAKHARMHSWAFGQAILVTSDSSGFRVVPAWPSERRKGPPTVALTVRSPGLRESCAFEMPYKKLGLPADFVRAARSRLRASPLYELVQDHLVLQPHLSGLSAGVVAAAGTGLVSAAPA